MEDGTAALFRLSETWDEAGGCEMVTIPHAAQCRDEKAVRAFHAHEVPMPSKGKSSGSTLSYSCI